MAGYASRYPNACTAPHLLDEISSSRNTILAPRLLLVVHGKPETSLIARPRSPLAPECCRRIQNPQTHQDPVTFSWAPRPFHAAVFPSHAHHGMKTASKGNRGCLLCNFTPRQSSESLSTHIDPSHASLRSTSGLRAAFLGKDTHVTLVKSQGTIRAVVEESRGSDAC